MRFNNKSEQIRNLIDKGIDPKLIQKRLGVSPQLFYAVAKNYELKKSKAESKLDPKFRRTLIKVIQQLDQLAKAA